MNVAALKSVALMVLTMVEWKGTCAPVPEEVIPEIHQGVLAMRAGYFEGDIVMEESAEAERTATSDGRRLWPDGIIPYTTDYRLRAKNNVAIIRNVMDSIQAKTCLRFVPRGNQIDYVHLEKQQGCFSYLGRHGGKQTLSLGDDCLYKGTVTHELLHAAGFYHEHTRPDRDAYVKIFPENIEPEFRFNFKKVHPSQIRFLTAFDYDSVMLYGSDSFARRRGLPSMLAKNGTWLRDIYSKPGLSKSDVTRINKLYNCTM